MRGMQGTWGMFTRIPGNVFILVFRGMLENISGSFQEDSGECSEDFRKCFQFYINESYNLLKKANTN